MTRSNGVLYVAVRTAVGTYGSTLKPTPGGDQDGTSCTSFKRWPVDRSRRGSAHEMFHKTAAITRRPGMAPKGEIVEDVPAELREELKKEMVRGREEMMRTILAEARKVMPQYGIELVDVRIKRLDYVESVREKVYARMTSERKRIAAQFRSEGKGRSAEILGTMEKELRQIRSIAYRQVQEVRGRADAEATRVYGAAFGADPEFYAFSRTLESYKEAPSKNATLILTTNSDYYRCLKQSAAIAGVGSTRSEGRTP